MIIQIEATYGSVSRLVLGYRIKSPPCFYSLLTLSALSAARVVGRCFAKRSASWQEDIGAERRAMSGSLHHRRAN